MKVPESLLRSFVKIKAGEFKMGSPVGEEYRNNNENQPEEPIRISRAFEIMRHEVTQEQWHEVMEENPSHFKKKEYCNKEEDYSELGGGMCRSHPVERVSWDDVQEFIRRLNTAKGPSNCKGKPSDPSGCYRLPTEAEWEYATRAGTTTAYYFGNGLNKDEMNKNCWWSDNSGGRTHKVMSKTSNAWGLYDVCGNVWEWVQDKYSSDLPGHKNTQDPLYEDPSPFRVDRGGGWLSDPQALRSANRKGVLPWFLYHDLGFRLVRNL